MRIGLFYYSQFDGPNRQRIVTPLGTAIYIRVVEVYARSLDEALCVAQPEEDESVMNTHELPS